MANATQAYDNRASEVVGPFEAVAFPGVAIYAGSLLATVAGVGTVQPPVTDAAAPNALVIVGVAADTSFPLVPVTGQRIKMYGRGTRVWMRTATQLAVTDAHKPCYPNFTDGPQFVQLAVPTNAKGMVGTIILVGTLEVLVDTTFMGLTQTDSATNVNLFQSIAT